MSRAAESESTASRVNEPKVLSSVRVVLLGAMLLGTGALGFYTLPGMIADNAEGSRLVNSIYCSAITLTT
jgi:hypothetical protein